MGLDVRWLALGEEVLTSIRLIESGLAEIQRIDGANDFYHPALLLLSAGLERLMKCILCFRFRMVHDSFPSTSALKAYNHDLDKILKEVVDTCFDTQYRGSQAAADADAIYLQSDQHLKNTLGALSQFALSSRYYNLDIVSGRQPTTDSPEQEWLELEREILHERPDLIEALKSPGGYGPIFDEISREFVSRFERVARAMCRLFTLGPLGEEAKVFTGYIRPFLFLTDEDIGKRDYRVKGAA